MMASLLAQIARGLRGTHSAARLDPETCPHEDVLDVSETRGARPRGTCADCDTSLVANDEGDWEAP
jgi:hypothetical protein